MNRFQKLVVRSAFVLVAVVLPVHLPAVGEEGDIPPLPFRECYCPAHFGNAYEAMGPREMKAYLAELKWMGFNRYGDWLTTTDINNPYTSRQTWDLGKALLDRKKKAFLAAQSLGLDLNVIVTPNHVYLNQIRPENIATRGHRIQGQLICPSKPEGRKIILGNFKRWFEDFARSGIRLNAFTAFAYDYGGCGCNECKPWILTFARLTREIHEMAQKSHPGIEPWFASWWWTVKDHEIFNEWAAKNAPGWLKGMTMHLGYGKTRPKDVAVPDGCRKLAFVHIGYDNKPGLERYGKIGGVLAPVRLSGTVGNLRKAGFKGFQAYSEGFFDDLNKMILAGMGSGRCENAGEAIRAYAERYYGAKSLEAEKWSKWFLSFHDSGKKGKGRRSEFDALTKQASSGWRFEQWKYRLELERIHRLIGRPKPDEWTPEKLALADEFFAVRERLYREVWSLGPVRHVLNPRFGAPAWVKSWRNVKKRKPVEKMKPEQ